MPTNITDVVAFTSPVVAPADSDAGNAASVVQGLQPLANRTAYLNNILNTTGITQIRTGTAAAMQAATSIAAGAVWYVASQGLYFYNSTAAIPVDGSLVYAATGMGAGRWIHSNYSLINANLGLPFIGPVSGTSGVAANRIASSVVPNAIVGSGLSFLGTLQSTSSNVSADIPGFTTSFTANAGDLILGMWTFYCSNVTGGSTLNVIPEVVDGGTLGTPYGVNNIASPGSTGLFTYSFPLRYFVVNAGTITLKAAFATQTGTTLNVGSNSSIAYTQIRP